MLSVQEELKLNKIAYSVICERRAENSYKLTDGLSTEQLTRIHQIIDDYVLDKARKIAAAKYNDAKEMLQNISPWLRERVQKEVTRQKGLRAYKIPG